MKHAQSSHQLLMIKPVQFHYNDETAPSNAFMHTSRLSHTEQNYLAQKEFEQLTKRLTDSHIDLTLVDDTPTPSTPDSVFPNNWISTHQGGLLITYPMEACNRRLERKPEVLSRLQEWFVVNEHWHLESFEARQQFLEGTGSVVFDRPNRLAYAGLSSRTHPGPLQQLCDKLGYKAITFDAVSETGQAIYHTNVMMAIGSDFAACCLDSIQDKAQQTVVRQQIEATKSHLLALTRQQIAQFAGNLLELRSTRGEPVIALSETAWLSYDRQQQRLLESLGDICHSPIPTIERHAGGSVRCMLAEVFLERR